MSCEITALITVFAVLAFTFAIHMNPIAFTGTIPTKQCQSPINIKEKHP